MNILISACSNLSMLNIRAAIKMRQNVMMYDNIIELKMIKVDNWYSFLASIDVNFKNTVKINLLYVRTGNVLIQWIDKQQN